MTRQEYERGQEVLLHDDRSTRQQHMHMSSLWYPFARIGISGQSIALDNRDLFKMIREGTGGHTSADYDSVVPVERALHRLFAPYDLPPSRSRAASPGWLDILIHVEQIARIIRGFDLCQSGVVVAVGCLHGVCTLIHHHVDIPPARRVGM